jgi:hypothetical protein
MASLWRRPFDLVERPLAAASESWVQSETFMDLAAVAFRVRRRVTRGLQERGEQGLHTLGLLSRADVLRVANQVASLERQVRDLRRELERRDERDRGSSGPLNGRAARSDGGPARERAASRGGS